MHDTSLYTQLYFLPLKQKYTLTTFCYFNLFLSIAFNSALSPHQKGNELQVPACLIQQPLRSVRSLQMALQKLQQMFKEGFYTTQCSVVQTA